MSERIWVLSPISASATTPVDTRKACMFGPGRRLIHDRIASPAMRRQCNQSSRQVQNRLRHAGDGKSVDVSPSPLGGRLLPNDGTHSIRLGSRLSAWPWTARFGTWLSGRRRSSDGGELAVVGVGRGLAVEGAALHREARCLP